MEDKIHFPHIERPANILLYNLETRFAPEVIDVRPSPRREVIHGDDTVPFRQQSIT
jgi:hypothetical protein